jgi:hypothetical protein
VKFKPREGRGSLKNKSGGGTRGNGEKLAGDAFVLCVLAPDEVMANGGRAVSPLTISAQPTLFWFISKPAAEKYVFTISDASAGRTVAKVNLGALQSAGIQRIDLADEKLFGKRVELKPEVDYEWNVKPASSRDILSKGFIRRIDPPPGVEAPSTDDVVARAARLAEAGIWYDALAAVSQGIDKNPQDASLHQARADLLDQVGLSAAAEADRGSAAGPTAPVPAVP